MKKKKILGLVIVLIGMVFFFYPFFSVSIDDYIQNKELEYFIESELKKEQSYVDKTKKYEPKYSKSVKNNLLTRNDDKIGNLYIPKLEQSFDLYKNADMKKISKGVAITKESDMPSSGVGSRTVIAGHRGYYNKRMFKDIDKLSKGDHIFVKYSGNILEYTVSDKEIIEDDEISKLNSISEREILTLLTCGSQTDSSQRLIVNCDRNIDNSQRNKKAYKNKEDVVHRNFKNNNDRLDDIIIKKMIFKVMSFIGIIMIIVVMCKIFSLF